MEFSISDLAKRYSIEALTEQIYRDVTSKVDENDVIGVQVFPKKWPRKVQVLCAHQPSKDCLLIQGLDIEGQHIDLCEPGQGVTKVFIEDAPLVIPNDFLKSWIAQYGTVMDFRNEQ